MSERDLTPRQRRFADVWASGQADSKAEAARLAGYAPGGSVVAQSVAGVRALNSDKVQSAVAERRQSLAEQAGISPVRVLQRIEARAASSITPPATAQRADEYLGDVLNLRDSMAVNIDARNLTIAASSDDVREIASLIADRDAD